MLASSDNNSANTIHSVGVQLLGTNLAIETTWKSEHESLPDRKRPPWFIPRFPTTADVADRADVDIKPLESLRRSVYPWFQGPSITLSKKDTDLENRIRMFRFSLCEANVEGDPNSIPQNLTGCNYSRARMVIRRERVSSFVFHGETHVISLLLTPAKNYGLCVETSVANEALKDRNKATFSVCVLQRIFPFSSTSRQTVLLVKNPRPQHAAHPNRSSCSKAAQA